MERCYSDHELDHDTLDRKSTGTKLAAQALRLLSIVRRSTSGGNEMPEGYTVVANDWPSDVPSPDLSSEQISSVLRRFEEIYSSALEDLSRTPPADSSPGNGHGG